MALQSNTASRAAYFMRQCRNDLHQPRHPRTPKPPATRNVSSSHLAPSNFSKQTRRRDTEVQHTRFGNSSASRNTILRNPRPISIPSLTTTAIPPGILSFLKYRVLNLTLPQPPAHKPPPFNVLNNPWRTRKTWPPDFANMHSTQQFHFEKTFRRRLLLKTNSQRYNWNRYIKLIQQSLIVFTVIYFIFIADPYAKDGGGTPVDGFRAWFFGQIGKFEHMPEGLREQAAELERYYGKNWTKSPWGEAEDGDGDGSSNGAGEEKGKTEAA